MTKRQVLNLVLARPGDGERRAGGTWCLFGAWDLVLGDFVISDDGFISVLDREAIQVYYSP